MCLATSYFVKGALNRVFVAKKRDFFVLFVVKIELFVEKVFLYKWKILFLRLTMGKIEFSDAFDL